MGVGRQVLVYAKGIQVPNAAIGVDNEVVRVGGFAQGYAASPKFKTIHNRASLHGRELLFAIRDGAQDQLFQRYVLRYAYPHFNLFRKLGVRVAKKITGLEVDDRSHPCWNVNFFNLLHRVKFYQVLNYFLLDRATLPEMRNLLAFRYQGLVFVKTSVTVRALASRLSVEIG